MRSNARTTTAAAALLLVLALAPAASAHRWYTVGYPNADRVPCPPGVDCHGSPYCLAPGHEDCVRGEVNDFGDEWEERWAPEYALDDSDGDGYTNAEELGAPCVDWAYGTQPRHTDPALLGNPGFRSSRPAYGPCNVRSDEPTAPTGLRVARTGSGRAELRWEHPAGLDQECLCRYELSVSGQAARQVAVEAATDGFVLCGLEAGAEVDVTVLGLKGRAETARSATLRFVASGAAGDADALACGAASPRPSNGPAYDKGFPPDVLATLGLFAILVALAALLHRGARDPSKLRACCVHWRPLGCLRARGWRVHPLNLEQSLIAGATLAAGASAFLYWHRYNEDMVYVWGGRASVGRGLGRAALVPFFAALLPVTKHSVWRVVAGVSVDRAVRFHRLFALLFTGLSVAHGVLLGVSYHNGAWGLGVLLSKGEEYNTWAGTLSGAFFVVLVLAAMQVFRRLNYGFFKALHIVLFLLGTLFMVIHIPYALFYALPGVVLWGVDRVLLTLDGVVRPTTVIAARRFEGADGEEADRDPLPVAGALAAVKERREVGTVSPRRLQDLCGPRDEVVPAEAAAGPDGGRKGTSYKYLRLTLHKTGYSYRPGQFAFLWVPSLSKLAHPYSLMGAPYADGKSDVAEVVIKSMGPGTWSDRLVNHPGWVRDSETGALSASFHIVMVAACGVPEVQPDGYDEAVFFAGGVGVTPMAGLFSNMARRAPARERPQNVSLVWSYREESVVREVVDRLAFQDAMSAGGERDAERGADAKPRLELPAGFTLALHRTGLPKASGARDAGVEMAAKGGAVEARPAAAAADVGDLAADAPRGVACHQGRPNVEKILAAVRERALQNGTRRVAVAACGPEGMCADVERHAERLSGGGVTFDVHFEHFEW